MVAGEGAANGFSEAAVRGSLSSVVARSDGEDMFVTCVAILIDAFVSIARGEANDAATSVAPVSRCVINSSAGAVRKRFEIPTRPGGSVVEFATGHCPTAGDHVRSMIRGPGKRIR